MIFPWWIKLGAVGMVFAAVFFAGDRYGFNASNYAACKTATARRNAAISAVNRTEEKVHAAERTKWEADRAAFEKALKGLGQCILTGDQAAALNGIGE